MATLHRSLDRVLGRVDNLDPVNLANLVQRLARERSFFEGIFEAVREGILVVDERGTIDYANGAASRMVALKKDDIGKASLWRLVPGLRESLHLEPGDGLDGQAAQSREIELTYPETRIVRLYIVPFREEIGEGIVARRFAVILSDITQEAQSNEERMESERISSILLLAAGVAHEIGNPLNSLTIHLQLIKRQLKKLKETTPTAEKIASSINVCEGEVERLDGIIRHFLEAIRPQPPDFQNVDLLETLEEVLSVQSLELSNRELNIEIEAASGPAIVRADRNQVKQVFFNLVKNAMESMQSGGHLRIKARGDDEFIFLQFGDTGQGIPQDDLTRLFQPFHTTKKGGHGLGLMIVQRIMREHGGQVGIDSREGMGTVVTLQFPRRDRRVRLLEK